MCQHIKEVAGDHKARSLFGERGSEEGEVEVEDGEEEEGGAELTTSVQEFQRQKRKEKVCVRFFFFSLPFLKVVEGFPGGGVALRLESSSSGLFSEAR